MKHGKGKFKWASGNTYEGDYEHDERHGVGNMKWTDGSEYRGDWVQGVQHGRGSMSFADGTLKSGLFENNVFIEEIIDEEPRENEESSMIIDS